MPTAMDSQCCLSSNHIHFLRTTTSTQHHHPFLGRVVPAAAASSATTLSNKFKQPCSGIITCTLVNPKISILTHSPILLPPRETFPFHLPSPPPVEQEPLTTDPPPIQVSHDSLKYESGFLGATTQEKPGEAAGVHNAMNYLTKILSSKVYDVAVETPLEYAPKLSERSGVHVWLKREDLQPVFSFKLRGAYNMMAKLTNEQLAKGVICSSAGNHAQGVALSAQRLGCNATIIMPVTTPEIKWKAVEKLGGKVVLVGETYDEAEAYAKRQAEKEKIAFVPPFDHPDVIAGQGTVGMEIMRQFSGSSLHAIFVPVGGGGLIAGIAAYVKRVRPEVKVIGVEPYDANAMALSLHHGQRVILDHVGSFAGGVAVKSVGKETFSMCKELVDGIVLVGRDSICASIKDMFEEKRSILEPAGALALAGAEAYCKFYGLKGESVVAIASGANMNFDRLRLVTQLADVGRQREAVLAAFLPERKGMFKQFRELVGPINITEFKYRYDAQRKEALVLFSVGLHTSSELGQMLHRFKSAQLRTINLTDNELVKDHLQHLVGGRSDVENELLCRFIIPERPEAFAKFLEAFCPRYNISLFHYRAQGDSGANVLTGFQVASSEMDEFKAVAERLGFAYEFEMNNEALQLLMQ